MTKRFKLAGLLAAFMLFSGIASAVPIDFKAEGSMSGWGSNATTSGSITDGLLDGWSFTTNWHISGEDVIGTNWLFSDSSGNSLTGTFTGKLFGLVPIGGIGFLEYLITSGTGIFSGATGTGISGYGLLFGGYEEIGRLNVSVVPEPGTMALLAAGLVLMVFAARRRRAAWQR